MPNKFYLTTPIYYVNARPHIGHAYTTLAADTIARRHRLLGDETFFLTGTDEHGQKIERSAAAAGIPPQQFADEVSASFENLWKRMGITNNAFIRTTSDAHKRGAQKLFADLYERGFIELRTYTGQYCVSEEMFVEGPPGTIGPDGKPTETVSEENFFFKLSRFQQPLIDLIQTDTLLIRPEARKNEVLSFLRGNVPGSIDSVHFDVTYERVADVTKEEAEVLAKQRGVVRFSLPTATFPSGHPYAAEALRDLSVSRSSFTWGIPVPEPASSKTKQPHVIYVWLDALANYMTALGYGSEEKPLFEKFWPADLHLVGKEIIRFHCVYWPAFLLALNPKLQHAPGEPTPELSFEEHKEWAENWLPKAVTAHGWLLFDDSKMSKSKGNIVRAETILDAFGEHVYKKQFPDSTKEEQDLFATDVLRYFLLREIPFGQDGSFSFDAVFDRYNADLTNGLGNLAKRILTLVETNCQARTPASPEGSKPSDFILSFSEIFFGYMFGGARFSKSESGGMRLGFRTGESLEILIAGDLAVYKFSQALELIIWAISQVDYLISESTPWKLAKLKDQQSHSLLMGILHEAVQSLRIITALAYPVLPHATAKIWQQLGLGDIELAAKNGELTNLQWGGLQPGTKLGPLSPIFPRADKGLAQIMIDMEAKSSKLASQQVSGTVLIEETASTPEPQDTNHPGAGPRTATLPDLTPGTTVGGSNALTTERTHNSHTEAAASGIFAADQGTSQIGIDDFLKVDLRVAQVLVAERIPKADKLLRLEVDLGYEKRQILSGIAEWYTPEELLGRRIVIVANLAPRKMRGLESHGMLLAASAGDNTKPILTTFADTETLPLGSRVR